MMAAAKLERPRIPIDVFRKMVSSLSPAELGNLPPEKLPVNIPSELLEEAPLESQSVLEDLIFAAESFYMKQRLDVEERFGSEVAEALELSRQNGSATLNKMFRGRIEQLQLLHARWEASEEQSDLRALLDNIRQLDDLLPHVRDDGAIITRATKALQSAVGQESEYQVLLGEAREQLVSQLEDIDTCLGEYFVIRLMVMGVEMQRTASRVSSSDGKVDGLEKEARTIQRRIDNLVNVRKLTPEQASRDDEIVQLQRELEMVRDEIQQNDVLISEADLISWLDLVVDASLSPAAGNQVLEGKSKDMRMALFQLLVRYCKSQEDAARQIADNPFSQADPEQAIRYMLKSEEFVLDYFANKRRNMTEWLGEVAQKKMDSLKSIESNMIETMREKISQG